MDSFQSFFDWCSDAVIVVWVCICSAAGQERGHTVLTQLLTGIPTAFLRVRVTGQHWKLVVFYWHHPSPSIPTYFLGSIPEAWEQTEKSDDVQRWRCPGGEWVYALDIGAEAWEMVRHGGRWGMGWPAVVAKSALWLLVLDLLGFFAVLFWPCMTIITSPLCSLYTSNCSYDIDLWLLRYISS